MEKAYLPEADIQKYEAMELGQLGSVFFTLGVQKGANMFKALLTSYRVAASVANAAWGLVKELEAGQITPDTWVRITRALNDYSPGNFPPHAGDIEFACHVLENLYNRASEHPDRNAVVYMIYSEIEKLQKRLPRLPAQ